MAAFSLSIMNRVLSKYKPSSCSGMSGVLEWLLSWESEQGGGGTWIPNTGWEGGGPAGGRKKK